MPINAFDKNTWTESERFYFDYVEKMLEKEANIVVRNGRPLHAVYLIEAFLRKAQKTVRLFSGSLKQQAGEVKMYGDSNVVNAAKNFLSHPNSKFMIVLENPVDLTEGQRIEDHPVIKEIRELCDGERIEGMLEIRRAAENNIKFLRDQQFCHHMMIMDDRAYRLETDPEQFKAHVNFGDGRTAEKLARIFDRILFDSGERLLSIPS